MSEDQTVLPEGWEGSTYRNPTIKTYADLAHRIKVRLGYPSIQINVTDEAIANNINEAIEMYSRYAGYDTEYLVFCDSILDSNCEVRLDLAVTECQCQSLSIASGGMVEETIVVGHDVTQTLFGTHDSLINSYVNIEGNDDGVVNTKDTPTVTPTLELFFDPTNPWDFDTTSTNKVVVKELDSYPDDVVLSVEIPAWIKVEDGIAEFYPLNWEELDPCLEVADWWGLNGGDEVGFNPTEATHINVTNVPFGTVGGLNPLTINTGKAGQFRVLNHTLNTNGYITATIQFIKSLRPPQEILGEFEVIQNNGFKLNLGVDNELPYTPNPVGVSVEFYNEVKTEIVETVEVPFDKWKDEALMEPRKVSGVFDVNSNNAGHGNILFNFEYAYMQNALGYNGLGGRTRTKGADLVTYNLTQQFIESTRRMLGGNSVTYNFNPKTQKLKVIKSNSYLNQNRCYILGLRVERQIEHMVNETWVADYTTALTKIIMGNTLQKFGGATTIGGLTINGGDVLSQGMKEKEELLVWLREQNSEGGFDMPFYVF